MVSLLVKECGVYFGEEEDLKPADPRNPSGFFEHQRFFELSRALLRQAGHADENFIYPGYDFRARGVLAKLKRIITRFRMLIFLKSFGAGKEKIGFKMFPPFFYFWKSYLPRPKIIGVFRDPVASAHSLVQYHAGGRYTFEQALSFWNHANRDLIYHLSVNEGILIKYEELFDPAKQEVILKTLSSLVGGGDTSVLKNLIDTDLNRAGKAVENLKNIYPLNNKIRKTLEALNKLKV